jgi:hypothetical protein
MRCYTTILDGDADILPYFVRHYRRLGADTFPVLVYGKLKTASGKQLDDVPRTHAHARKIIEAEGGRYFPLGSFPQARFTARNRDLFIRSRHPEGEWAFFPDLDEFAAVTPQFVQEVVSGARACPFVEATWIDRVGPGGALVKVDASKATLEEQFPMATNKPLAKVLGFGSPVYVLSPVGPRIHHPNVCEWGSPQRKKSIVVRSHHFKWQSSVLLRLRRRLRRIRLKGKRDSRWAHRVGRQLRHLEEHNGIRESLLREVGSVLGI